MSAELRVRVVAGRSRSVSGPTKATLAGAARILGGPAWRVHVNRLKAERLRRLQPIVGKSENHRKPLERVFGKV